MPEHHRKPQQLQVTGVYHSHCKFSRACESLTEILRLKMSFLSFETMSGLLKYASAAKSEIYIARSLNSHESYTEICDMVTSSIYL